ncbi:MAG: toxin VasX [Pseudomonadota bacterium]|nr:toxin VasX [Pseudomonadota bacterium]
MGTQQRIQMANQTAASHPAKDSRCGDCVKSGIPVLPTVYRSQPYRGRSANLTHLIPDALSKQYGSSLACLPTGYLYVFYEQSSFWMGYVVGTDGAIRSYPVMALPANPSSVALKAACTKAGHDIPTQFISLFAHMGKQIWMAYSPHLWTESVRLRYQNDAKLRTQRMTSIQLADQHSLIKGGSNGHLHMGDLQKYVIDYSVVERNFYNAAVPAHHQVTNRTRQANNVWTALRQMADTQTQPNIVALPDPVGDLAILNSQRNQLQIDINAIIAGKTELEQRKRVIYHSIKTLLEQADSQAINPLVEKHYRSPRYLRHIDQKEYRRIETDMRRLDTLTQQHQQTTQRHLNYMQRAHMWRTIQRHDFDPENDHSALAHRAMCALSISGISTEAEYTALIEPMLSPNIAIEDNWLIRFFGSLDPATMRLLHQALQKYDQDAGASASASPSTIGQNARAYETGKGGAAILLQFFGDFGGSLTDRIATKRAADLHMQGMISSMSAVLAALSKKSRKSTKHSTGYMTQSMAGYRKLTALVSSALVTTERTIALPIHIRGEAAALSYYLSEMFKKTGTPTSEIEAKALNNLQQGHHISTARAEVITLMVVRKLKAGEKINPALLNQLKVSDIDLQRLSMPQAIKLSEAKINTISGGVGGALSIGLAYYQSLALMSSLEALAGSRTLSDAGMNGLAAASSGLTLTAAAFEVKAAHALIVGNPLKAAQINVLAAKIGAGAAVAEAASLFATAVSGKNTIQHRVYAGANTFAVAVMGFSGIGLAESTFAVVATRANVVVSTRAVWLLLSPWGWFGLLALSIGTTLYLYMQMHATDETKLLPIEYWLDMGVFGKRQRMSGIYKHQRLNPYLSVIQTGQFANLADELNGLRLAQVMFDPMISINGNFGQPIDIKMALNVSHWSELSAATISVLVIDRHNRTHIAYQVIRRGHQTTTLSQKHANFYFNHGGLGGVRTRSDRQKSTLSITCGLTLYGRGGGMGVVSNNPNNHSIGVLIMIDYIPDGQLANYRYSTRTSKYSGDVLPQVIQSLEQGK